MEVSVGGWLRQMQIPIPRKILSRQRDLLAGADIAELFTIKITVTGSTLSACCVHLLQIERNWFSNNIIDIIRVSNTELVGWE